MDYLKEWVRGLVVLVLLASCLELFLPMGNMKKYVKMTMGLLIVLATLKPIFGLLGQPIANVSLDFLDKGSGPSLPTLNQIMAEANRFREKNQALASEEVQSGLAAEAARAARSVKGVADARASIELQDAGSEVKIRRVTVTVTPGTPGGVAPVQPVTPVSVTEVPPDPAGRPVAAAPSDSERRLLDAVREEVATRLGLRPDPDVVRITVERSSDSQRR
jgi:stage III sporulation protein AF